MQKESGTPSSPGPVKIYPIRSLLAWLGNDPQFTGKPETILSVTDLGPPLLWGTPHAVVATPYHRNTEGILDAHRFFSAMDPHSIRSIVESRRVTLVLIRLPLLRSGPPENGIFFPSPINFYQKLANGNPPLWLKSVPVPEGLNQAFRLYRVEDEKAP